MGSIAVKILPAGYGDSFLIEFDNGVTILVDGGTRVSMQNNIGIIEQSYSQNQENYVMLTHVDNDHVMGIIHIFERHNEVCNKIKGVFFNSFSDLKKLTPNIVDMPPQISINDSQSSLTGYRQGIALEEKFLSLGIDTHSNIAGAKFLLNEVAINILSPGVESMSRYSTWAEKEEIAYTGRNDCDYAKSLDELLAAPFIEDDSITNASSISVLINYKNKSLLFLGDSIPSDIVHSLVALGYSSENKLQVDIAKVSHHGSRYNTSPELLAIIQCDKFIISTDGKLHGHPDKECLARIIDSQECPELIFNYNIYHAIFSPQEIDCNNFKVCVKNEVIL